MAVQGPNPARYSPSTAVQPPIGHRTPESYRLEVPRLEVEHGRNALLELWTDVQNSRRWEDMTRPGLVRTRRWPSTTDDTVDWMDEYRSIHELREWACSRYAYAVPNEDALSTLVRLGPIIEVAAGLGYWAALLRARGADIVASDLGGDLQREWTRGGYWSRVWLVDAAEAAAAYPDRALLLVWPPYGLDVATRALRAYLDAGGRTVAYVGEWDGCTADETFHYELEAACDSTAEVWIPQWDGLHDTLTVWTR